MDYYTRLERGNLNGVSESVLEALARALQLDEAVFRGRICNVTFAGTISRIGLGVVSSVI